MLIMVSPFNAQDAPPATASALDRARQHFAKLRARIAKRDTMHRALVRVKTKHRSLEALPPGHPAWLTAIPVQPYQPQRVNLKALNETITGTAKRGRGRPKKAA